MILDFFRRVDKFVAEAPISLVVLLGFMLALGFMAFLVWVSLLIHPQ